MEDETTRTGNQIIDEEMEKMKEAMAAPIEKLSRLISGVNYDEIFSESEDGDDEDEDRLSSTALGKISNLCEQFVISHPRHFLTDEGVTVSQRSGICPLYVNDIYLLHEESAPSIYPAECGFAITDAGICVKEFRKEDPTVIPYGDLICKNIHSTLGYSVYADDILLAQYLSIDNIIIIPKLTYLFINIQRYVQREWDGAYLPENS